MGADHKSCTLPTNYFSTTPFLTTISNVHLVKKVEQKMSHVVKLLLKSWASIFVAHFSLYVLLNKIILKLLIAEVIYLQYPIKDSIVALIEFKLESFHKFEISVVMEHS